MYSIDRELEWLLDDKWRWGELYFNYIHEEKQSTSAKSCSQNVAPGLGTDCKRQKVDMMDYKGKELCPSPHPNDHT